MVQKSEMRKTTEASLKSRRSRRASVTLSYTLSMTLPKVCQESLRTILNRLSMFYRGLQEKIKIREDVWIQFFN